MLSAILLSPNNRISILATMIHAVHLYDILSQLDFYHNEKATVNITMTFLYFYLDVFYKKYNLNDYFV